MKNILLWWIHDRVSNLCCASGIGSLDEAGVLSLLVPYTGVGFPGMWALLLPRKVPWLGKSPAESGQHIPALHAGGPVWEVTGTTCNINANMPCHHSQMMADVISAHKPVHFYAGKIPTVFVSPIRKASRKLTDRYHHKVMAKMAAKNSEQM